MSHETQYPSWVTNAENQQSAKLKFIIRRAALMHNDESSISLLADDLGVTTQAFYATIERGYFTKQLLCSMRNLLGSEVVPDDENLTKNSMN